jgi:hypothetical protein
MVTIILFVLIVNNNKVIILESINRYLSGPKTNQYINSR